MVAFYLGIALLSQQVHAQNLPELGDSSGTLLSPFVERKIGEQAMRDIRSRDPNFLDDPELTEYINDIGRRLVAVSPDAQQDFEFFLMRDNTINAFAMPGGFIGVNTGLLLAAVHHAGLVSLTHTPSPMKFLNRILGRPADVERPFLLLVVGYPAEDARVPDIRRKPLGEIADFI